MQKCGALSRTGYIENTVWIVPDILMFKQMSLFTRGGSMNLATGVHSAGGGAQRWGTPVLTKWPMKIDARLKTWEAPDEQTVDAVQTRV
jgi:hypothetical protein